MTEWQWKVIITLCKIVVKLVDDKIGDRAEFYHSDTALLHEAIERENQSS